MKNKMKIIFLFLAVFYIIPCYAANVYENISDTISKELKNTKVKKIAVIPFDYTGKENSRGPIVISERINTAIIKNGGVEVFERNLLNKVLSELKFQQSGAVDINTIKKIGSLSGVEAIITGTMFDTGIDEIELNVRCIDVETGKALASAGGKIKKDWVDIIPENKWDIEASTESAAFYCKMAVKELDKPNYEKAIWLFTQAIKDNLTGECGTNKKGFAYLERGKAYLNQEKYDKAIKDFNFLAELDEKNEEVYFYRGLTYLENNQYEKAILDLNKAIELNPNFAEAYSNRGFSYYSLKDFDKAIDDYSKAIELSPYDDYLYNNRGLAYYFISQYDKAIADFNKAIELNPNYSEAYNNRGKTYHYLRQYNKAIDDFNKAIELNPNLSQAYYNRWLSYLKIGEYEKAKKDFEKYKELTGEY